MDEKYKYYFNRTLEHIQRVQRNAFYLIANHAQDLDMTEHDCLILASNVLSHDLSKFSFDYWKAYADFTWAKHTNTELTLYEQEEFAEAWKDHYSNENHHPIGFNTLGRMTHIQLIEVACDLQAMSQEFGEVSCRQYFENKWKQENETYFRKDVWEPTCDLMNKVINYFEKELDKA